MEVSAVRLRNSYQIYYVETCNLFVNQNSECIVEIDHGVDIGRVLKSPSFGSKKQVDIKGKLVRKADSCDMKQVEELESLEESAYRECREKIAERQLPMKLVAVKYLFDRTKLIFYFVAENRIDFRLLVKDLAAIFKTRIEMRQIGARDEAKLRGGFGSCGKEMCCFFRMDDFEPVSIKMAKEQSLNLNSMKISGMCGKLLCCLEYEYDTYKSNNQKLPQMGNDIVVSGDTYRVISVNTLQESVTIRDKERFFEVFAGDLSLSKGKYYLNDRAAEELFKSDDKEDDEEDFGY